LRPVSFLLMIGVSVAVFWLVLHSRVTLVPLVGFESRCARCDRKATRTLKEVAAALRQKGIYWYDRRAFGKAPAWCDLHDPDPQRHNAARAYLAGVAAFAMMALAGTTLPSDRWREKLLLLNSRIRRCRPAAG
jgi:hypothetical protein